MFDKHLTKRELGILCVGAGLLAFVGVLALDLIRSSTEGGIGPAQRIALVLAVILVLLGLSLLPLGDDTA